ncbi:graves disease carrier protein isoform X3 [Stegostoma tigrinum]|uniref:graves disease carrier protein isoform X3 n=1 Tax=Stegostoma tigrinum TaxID=3053191 RepID=UPI0028705D5B|nr:graves disease carrier protein isoform X3 [Stegostoma tigrinum]
MTTEAPIPASAKTGVGAPSRRDFFWLRSLVAGGIAGCCAKSTIAPLDRVKILLQAHNRHYKHLGVFSTLRAVPQKEGFLGLYKGNGAMMVRIFPYGAIQFTAFDRYRKEGGFQGFYRGLTPTIIGMAPYAGISFFTFGTLKSIGLSQAPGILGRPSSDNPNVLVLKTHVNLLCGGIAGAFAQTVSYPLDVARRRMQLGSILTEADKCVSMCKTLKYVYKVHGIRKGLYRGLTLNYIRCIPSQAVAFTTYELMRQVLHLN